MSLERRLRVIEQGTGGRAKPGSPTAAQHASQRILREDPDLMLVERDDCEVGWEGGSVFNYIQRLKARAEGNHPHAALLANVERGFRVRDGLEPEVPEERLLALALRAALHARARVEIGKRHSGRRDRA